MKRLPIGLQTFSEVIRENYSYVDKTPFVHKIVSKGKYYFLSRPRRFGKSLFLDTLAEAMEGNRELFQGLYLYDQYDFKSHPVIRLTFGSGDYSKLQYELETAFEIMFTANYRQLKLEKPDPSTFKNPKLALTNLILAAYEHYQTPVVILIDEYDKPILDNLTRPDTAREARDILKNLYSVLKDNDRYIRLAFITGVSKFSKLSLFSGLNNLEDITVNPAFGEICGYTQEDLETVFADAMAGASFYSASQIRKSSVPSMNTFCIILATGLIILSITEDPSCRRWKRPTSRPW